MTASVATANILVPYLAVHDARAAMQWYADVFEAQPADEPIVMPDGRIGHAELRIGSASVYLSDEHPEIDVLGPRTRGGTTVTLHLTVPDVDAVIAAAERGGAILERPAADQPYGRTGVVRDPFGHRWMVQSPVQAPVGNGDVVYVSLQVHDAAQARAFYGAVLGWQFGTADGRGQSLQVEGLSVPLGIWAGEPMPGVDRPGVLLVHRVDDIDAAIARVRSLGGHAEEPRREPYGVVADCLDDQGRGFTLHETPTGAPRPPLNGSLPGDISYITVAAPDEVRASAFYGALFGWHFAPGHVEHGLQVEGPAPMVGLWGGVRRQNATLMYRVDDIVSAVARVRANGGTATDPERQPYGMSSECVDDQGMAFYLGQH